MVRGVARIRSCCDTDYELGDIICPQRVLKL